jgi:exodeoxyribonuclease V beta subunit
VNPVTDALPSRGLLCVEASAGTGKTHLLSTLAVRWLLEREDIRIADLLVVSYTVASAAELRGRIRARLASVRDRLVDGAAPSGDEYLESLANGPEPHVARARAELALVEFDTAAICTIHAFAAAALGEGYGEVGTGEERRRQAVTDVLAVASFDDTSSLFDAADVSLDAIDRLAQLGLENPDIRLAPLEGATAEPGAWSQRDAVDRAMALFRTRSRRDGARTYADLLTQLDQATADERGPVCQLLRARFKVGLIDEFQDTDPIQWRIFNRLFVEVDDHALVVVGDPKQAIYGFRGADVSTYLTARSAAMDPSTGRGLGVQLLDRNYRSDGALLEALNAVFDGSTLDEAGEIAYEPVTPTPAAERRRLWLSDATLATPLSIRVPVPVGKEPIDAQRRAIAAECAAEAARSIGAVVRTDGTDAGSLSENDVVVLCQASTYFPMLREAFLREGIRTTETKSDDVLTSSAALDVAIVLRAMSDPGSPTAVAALAHSWICSESGSTTLARQRLASFEVALSTRGVVALARAITDPAMTPGLLERRFGERLLTDVHHLFDVLGDEAPHGAGPGSLLETLYGLEAASREGTDDDVRRRRIETDAPAVRMMTVHGAKGLEFGVVLCPFIQRTRDDSRDATIWREQGIEGRLLDAAGRRPWTDPRLSASTPEARIALAESAQGSESRRLQYVALTRARHRTIVWWLRAFSKADARRDELTGLLLDRDEDHHPVQRPRADRAPGGCYELLGDDALTAMRAAFGGLCEQGLLELEAVRRVAQADVEPAAPIVAPAPLGGARLDVATLERSLDVRPRRCSFSSLVAARHEWAPTFDATVGDRGADDEADDTSDDVAASDAAPFGGLRGAAFGTCIHEALEAAVSRPRGAEFDDAAIEALRRSMRWRSLEPSPAVETTLLEACAVPIDGGPSLRALDRDDVVAELRFCIPVAEHVDLGRLGETVTANDPDGPFGDWAREIARSDGRRPLASSLVGSIDLVTSLGREDCFAVIDYKTNLSDAATDAYGPEALREAMAGSDYPLQALLYLVALHRYLRWRVADYDPVQHLGEAHYLFLRGMRRGADDGVFTWRPPARLVMATSDLLAGVT